MFPYIVIPYMVISLPLIVLFENLHSYRDYVIITVKGAKELDMPSTYGY